MLKTTEHLRQFPELNLTCAFYDDNLKLTSETGNVIDWMQLSQNYDVAHIFTMFPRYTPESILHAFSKMPTLLSSVYWNNFFREWICVRNGDSVRRLLRSAEYIFRRLSGCKKTVYEKWCSGILPNSWAEGECFCQIHALPRHAMCYPVPNAIEIPDGVRDLPRPACVPDGDYIVYPGVFARRKNQLGFIKAMREYDYPVVFMGQPQREYDAYYQKCKDLASSNMYFIGHRSYAEREYWSVLQHARVAVLASDCETPGIAMIESAAMGARPVITKYGGTPEYFGLSGVYLSPYSNESIVRAVHEGWQRGRLTDYERTSFERFSWKWTAELTLEAYKSTILNWKIANG